MSGNRWGYVDHRRVIEKRRHPLFEAKQARIHVAIRNARYLIDAGMLQSSRAGRAEREDEIRASTGMTEGDGRGRSGCRGFDRSDAGDERPDASPEMGTVFLLGRHNEEDSDRANVMHGTSRSAGG